MSTTRRSGALRLARELKIGAPFGEVARAALRQLCAVAPEPVNESKIVSVARSQAAREDENTRG